MEAVTGDVDGDGYDDLITVYETSSRNPALQLSTVDKNTMTFLSNVPVAFGHELPAETSPFTGLVNVVTGDFTGEGTDQVIIGYPTGGSLDLEFYRYDATLASKLSFVSDTFEESIAATGEDALFDMAAADLNQDGDSEVVLVGIAGGGVYIRIYDFNEAGQFTSPIRATPNLPITGTIVALNVAGGDFDGDGQDEIGIGISSNDNGAQYASAHFAHVDLGLSTLTAGGVNSLETQLNPSGNFLSGSTAAGDLNASGDDELVVAVGRQVLVFEAELTGDNLKPSLVDQFTGNGADDQSAYFFTRDYIDVSDVDMDRQEEIVFLGNQYNDDGENAFQAFDVLVYGNTSNASIDLALKAQESNYLSGTTSNNNDFRRHFAVAFGDFNGDGIRAGKPRRFSKTEIIQPLVILNAPPPFILTSSVDSPTT